MKQSKTVIMLLIAVMMLITACGGASDGASGGASGGNASSGAGAGGGEKPQSAETKTVQFWYSISGTNADVVKALVEEFNNLNTGVKVNATFVPPGERLQKLTAAIGSGATPDLFTSGPPDLAALLGSNVLAPIDEIAKNKQDKIEPKQFLDVMQKLIVKDGKLMAVPVETGVMSLYYNADLFQKAGITAPPTTWEELVETAKKLSDPSKGQYGLLLPTAAEQYTGQSWLQFLYQAGGQMLTDDLKKAAFNSPEGVKALQLWVDLVHKHKVAPLQQLNNTSIPQTFATGNYGMFMSHPSWIQSTKQYPFKTLTARLPKDKKHASTLGGWYIIIPEKSQNKEAAYDFLAWVSKPENNVKWNAGTGSLPTNQATIDRPEYQEFVKQTPLVEPFLNSFKTDAIIPQPSPEFSRITVAISKAINEALYQKGTPEEALKKTADEVNKALQGQ